MGRIFPSRLSKQKWCFPARFQFNAGDGLADVETRFAFGERLAPTCRRLPEARARGVKKRRHLTVMFCDLVGSTELSARLDPENRSKSGIGEGTLKSRVANAPYVNG